jgi:hypothetical protein
MGSMLSTTKAVAGLAKGLAKMKGYEVGYASDKQKFLPHKLGKLLL